MTVKLNAEQRAEKRAAAIQRVGFDPFISEELADTLRERVQAGWIIVGEVFNGPSIHFTVNPRLDVSIRKRLDIESELSRDFGNSPHNLWTDFTSYRVSFGKTF